MVELSLARRLAAYLIVIFAVWFLFLGGGWHLVRPDEYYLWDALVLLLPTITFPLAIGFLGSLPLFPRAWKRDAAYRVYLALIAIVAVVLTSLYVSCCEFGLRIGMLVEQERLYTHEHGGFVELLFPPGGGVDRTLFIGIMSAVVGAVEVGRRKLAVGARDGHASTDEHTYRYSLPFEFWVLIVPAVSRIWDSYVPWMTDSFLDAAIWEPFMRSHGPASVALNVVGVVVFAVWYLRIRKKCSQEYLLVIPSGMRWMSGDKAIRKVAWEDVRAVSHLRVKPLRFLRVISADGSSSIPASCIDMPEELLGLIRQGAGLSEERKRLLFVRYVRPE